MDSQGKSLFAALVVAVLATLLVVACGKDKTPTGQNDGTIVGTWVATSFTIDTTDVVAGGMEITFSFAAGGGYTFSIVNDTENLFCDEGSTGCADIGLYLATGSTITFDPGTDSEVSFGYEIIDDTLTIAGGTITAVFQRI